MSNDWSRLGFSHFLARGWLIWGESSWDNSSMLHVRLMAIAEMFFSWQRQKDEKTDLELAYHHFCLILLDRTITWLNPISRESTIYLSMAKGANTRNDEILWLLIPCTTLAKRCCFLSFIRHQNFPSGATTTPHHRQAHCGGTRLMTWPKMWGRRRECSAPLFVKIRGMNAYNPEAIRKPQ